jgi:glyoxylase-like metal-dependent hydrolase (beta-lactamase superfamily II)
MMLEDHAGDVVRKARAMKNIAALAAAQAAGLDVEDFAAFERDGRCRRSPNFGALAALLGLNGAKLERLAQGWHPREHDLGRWQYLRRITTGQTMKVHAYLIWDATTGEAALFDTGFDAQPILQLTSDNKLLIRHVFITHGHSDHVASLEAVLAGFPKAHLHTSNIHSPARHRNRPNDLIRLGRLLISNRETPGHADDGVTYIVENWPDSAPPVAFVGDALFAGSMGGAPNSGDLARAKVREHILSLPPETLICPGHGPLTTVAEEKTNNPFF